MRTVVVVVKGRRKPIMLEVGSKNTTTKPRVHLNLSTPVREPSESEAWRAAEALFSKLPSSAPQASRPKPIVAVQPDRRVVHDTRLPHHTI